LKFVAIDTTLTPVLLMKSLTCTPGHAEVLIVATRLWDEGGGR